jgi:esterase/lipase superfamily enzyme
MDFCCAEAVAVRREYVKWRSAQLGREMELLIFGDGGLPAVAFPTSGGRFFEFEDRGMVGALEEKLESGLLQLYCVDGVDRESWYASGSPGRQRIERHMAYEQYVLEEVLPLVRHRNSDVRPMAVGCSFGGYHAANIALRHPEEFQGFVALSGIFDLAGFLDGYYDTDCYLNLPTHYLPQLMDDRYLGKYRQSRYVLATGWDDQCLSESQRLDRVMADAGIPHEFYVWNGLNTHDWPTWQRMAREYL